MAIPVSCACGKKLSVKDEFAGRKVKCPACQKLLKVPAAEEFAEDEFADEPAELPQKSRGGGKSGARGKGSKKGKKSSGSNRGLVIGLVAGGGVLVVALAAIEAGCRGEHSGRKRSGNTGDRWRHSEPFGRASRCARDPDGGHG
jgi:hypothetical protein